MLCTTRLWFHNTLCNRKLGLWWYDCTCCCSLLFVVVVVPWFHSLFSFFIFHLLFVAFGGDKSLKLLQQLVAASQAGRDVVFHPFAQNYNGKSMEEWIRLLNEMITLHHLTVGKKQNYR